MTSACQRCQGLGIVFDCHLWPGCGCPSGTMRAGCPGHSIACPECQAVAEPGRLTLNDNHKIEAKEAARSDDWYFG
jgi:hypothetical protein